MTVTITGLAALKLINGRLLGNVKRTGDYLLGKLKTLQCSFPGIIGDVRGAGLMVAMELKKSGKGIDGKKLVLECLKRGLMINCTQGNIIRFMPPLIVNRKDVDKAISVVEAVLEKG